MIMTADDMAVATRNRERVRKKENTDGYREAEEYIEHLSTKDKIKPQYKGEIPSISRLDWEQFGGNQTWIFEDMELWRTLESVVNELSEEASPPEDLTEDTGDVVE